MTDQELSEFLAYSWMPSRIPVLPALCAFSPDAAEPHPVITETLRRISGRSRWVVVPGGLRVVMPYHGESFDTTRFTVEPGGWDFDTCDKCVAGSAIRATSKQKKTLPSDFINRWCLPLKGSLCRADPNLRFRCMNRLATGLAR